MAGSDTPTSLAPMSSTSWSREQSRKIASRDRTSISARHCVSPTSRRSAAARTSDFYALTAFYVDIDDDRVIAVSEQYETLGCIPTAVVVTGRHPHPRAQVLWRLNAPVRDAEHCRRQNLAIAQTLGGDVSVVNPGRVLRLGGLDRLAAQGRAHR